MLVLCSCGVQNWMPQEGPNNIETPGPADDSDIILYPFRDSESMKWGYMDVEGTVLIEPQYDHADNFINDLAVVRIDDVIGGNWGGNWGVIDKNNNAVIPLTYDLIKEKTRQ